MPLSKSSGSRISRPDKPHFMTLDLDPSTNNDFEDVIAAAQCAHSASQLVLFFKLPAL
jgi:DNA primase